MSGQRSVPVPDSKGARPIGQNRRRGFVLSLGALALVLAGWFVPTQPAAAADTSPPSAPRGLSVVVNRDQSLTASWSASRDNVGVDRYIVYRNNAVVDDDVAGTTATVNLGPGNHWIQVRAVDAAGNQSPKTWPFKVSVEHDTSRPSAPRDLSVVVNRDRSLTASWSASRDNVGVDRYIVYRNNAVVLDDVAGTTATVDLGPGDHWIQVRAVDAAGNRGAKTWPVKVTVRRDTSPPGAPRDLSVVVNGDGSLTASWSASTDNVGVDRYIVYRNNAVVLDDVAGTTATVDLGEGDHWIQVRAVDAAGNRSVKTAPVKVTVTPPDTTSPSTPVDLEVVATESLEVAATWSPSRDDVGVDRYIVYRNNAVVDDDVADTSTTVDLGVGDHWIQVRAVDAAGNESHKTPPVKVTVTPPGTTPPPPTTVAPRPVEPPPVEPPPVEPPPADVPDTTSGGWDPLRARDEAGAVLPYRLDSTDRAATIVVDASGGGDFSSIRAAIGAAGSSDVIEVRSGVYRESIGVVNKPITLRAADGAHPIVLGTDRVEVASLGGDGQVRSVRMWSANPLKSLDSGLNEGSWFYGGLVDLNDPSSAADLLPEQVFWVGDDGRWHELTQVRHGALLTSGSFSYDPTSKTFAISVADWAVVDHLEITTRREGLRLLGGADGSTVSGFEFRAFSPPTDGDGWATVAANGNHGDRLRDAVLRDIEVTDSASNGISAYYATNLTLTRITGDHNVVKGFNSGRVLGMRMEFSRFNENNKDQLRDSHSILAGAKVTGSTGDDPGSVVRYNTFADNHATGYWCDLWCENDTIVGNYAGDNAKHGLYYEVSEDAVIASNLLVRNGAAGVKVSGSHRVDIVRNTFAGNGQQIHLGTDTRPRTGPGDGNRRPGHPEVIDTTAIVIRGNVFVEASGPAGSLLYRVGGATGEGDRNLPSERLSSYEANGHALNATDSGAQRFEWDHHQFWQVPSEFLANSGKGSSEITSRSTDPFSVFVAAANGDWRLVGNTSISSYAHGQLLPASVLPEMIGAGSSGSPLGAVFD